MHRIVASISSLSQHQDTLTHDPARYRPDGCPRCGFGTLWRHGWYYRKACRAPHGGGREPAAVPRFRCATCGATCSRLPKIVWHAARLLVWDAVFIVAAAIAPG
ncbi:hypothetical protein C4901_02150 [Acidiferrobacter sp. SPIII_3]|uniref:hypothetical protein n=1 Tax=Acidiferrobacter sp. SPIII_3 TaxID=1281578 RepID=UPI000D73C1F2|nr:hypothetical protein [Acidiferrobacter sp. SPIII_3]AWP22304.1 hypothetical protein C4901_02150 [Acidiferrobacter sp. SPIII_3]